MPAKRRRPPTVVTAVRLQPKLLGLATKKAEKMGLSRTKYIEQVLRKDLGLEGVDLDALDRTSVFG